MKLKELLNGVDVTVSPELKTIDIKSIVTNSRDVKKGCIFVAIEGSKFDGHRFIKEAFQEGARIAIVDKSKKIKLELGAMLRVNDTREALSVLSKNFYHFPSDKLKVVGITGTNGKTTTSILIESIFEKSGIPCGLIGTIEYRIGKDTIEAERTTPDALTVNALLDRMVKSKLKAAVLEVSSHALDQKRVNDIFYDAAVFTNLTHEHLDYHKDLEKYFKSKIKIFDNLKTGGAAIINIDDESGRKIKIAAHHKKITYGLSLEAQVRAEMQKLDINSSSFVVRMKTEKIFSINTRLVGMHNVSNILAAVATAVSQGIEFSKIKEGIESVGRVAGRLEAVLTQKPFKVFVDYAHTHNAMENVLKFLTQIKKARLITVFGCGGDRDRLKRPLMGRVAEELSDFVIVTSDNPRSEDPARIARDIEMGMKKKKGNHCIILDRKKAIENAFKRARTDDIVLIAGKGHEKFQIVGDGKTPFDDKAVCENILSNMKNKPKAKNAYR